MSERREPGHKRFAGGLIFLVAALICSFTLALADPSGNLAEDTNRVGKFDFEVDIGVK
jgi:hypothetical protein